MLVCSQEARCEARTARGGRHSTLFLDGNSHATCVSARSGRWSTVRGRGARETFPPHARRLRLASASATGSPGRGRRVRDIPGRKAKTNRPHWNAATRSDNSVRPCDQMLPSQPHAVACNRQQTLPCGCKCLNARVRKCVSMRLCECVNVRVQVCVCQCECASSET